jgi:23S rRNA pseudouridine1911/1915/1917 synthase
MQKYRQHELRIPEELAGLRLDQALARLLPEYSRSRLQTWIASGQVRVNGHGRRARDTVYVGDAVVVDAVLEIEVPPQPQAIALDVVYADESIIVINKPAGLVVHPGAGNPDRTLQNALLHFRPGLEHLPRAGIVHRLDKDTSGLMVVAASVAAHTGLVKAMAGRRIVREYEAICVGALTGGGRVDQPVGRHPVERTRMAVRRDGRPAVTHYRLLHRFRAHSHIGVRLETGRTHQIRVHMAWLRHPLVGDPLYGGRLQIPPGAMDELVAALRGFRRQALHACRLALAHPQTGEQMSWSVPAPGDFSALLGALIRDSDAYAGSGI